MDHQDPTAGYHTGDAGFRRLAAALFAAGLGTFALLYSTQALLPILSRDFGVSPASSVLTLAVTVGATLGYVPKYEGSSNYEFRPLPYIDANYKDVVFVRGLAAVRDSVVTELADVAQALANINQSFSFSGTSGHHAFSAGGGSSFHDNADFCDRRDMDSDHGNSKCVRICSNGATPECADMGGGGFAVVEVDGAEELGKMIAEMPFAPFSEVTAELFIEGDRGFRQFQDAMAAMMEGAAS